MRINSIQFYTNKNTINSRPKYNNKQNVTFTSWAREVYGEAKGLTQGLKHRNDTWFYRGNPDWTELTTFLGEKYKNVEKVNVYNWACSNGTEAYTFLMEMFSLFSKDFAKKFLPLTCLDYDHVAIEYATLGEMTIDQDEEKVINEKTFNKFDEYFTLTMPKRAEGYSWYAPKPILTDNVKFIEADILKDYKKMTKDNTVVFAKNFWPYIDYKDKVELAKNLYKHLGKNSTVIIGSFDNKAWDAPAETILRDAGFTMTEVENVFVKE